MFAASGLISPAEKVLLGVPSAELATKHRVWREFLPWGMRLLSLFLNERVWRSAVERGNIEAIR